MSLKSKIQALITAANAKTGETDATLTDAVQTLVDGYGGITPTGSVTLTEEKSYDVTDKATAVVDMSAKRASIAEVITSKGVDTLPDSDWDTLETNIGLISGGGGTNVDTGTFTTTKGYTDNRTLRISHRLGVIPDGFVIYHEPAVEFASLYDYRFMAGIFVNAPMGMKNSTIQDAFYGIYGKGWESFFGIDEADISKWATASDICFYGKSNDGYWYPPATYRWIAWKR